MTSRVRASGEPRNPWAPDSIAPWSHRNPSDKITFMAAKVVIENAVRAALHGSPLDRFSQKVATVYFEGGKEFRVMAPSGA